MVAINIKMPSYCFECEFCYESRDEYGLPSGHHYCYFNKRNNLGLEMFDKRRDDCPLVEIKENEDGNE